MLLFSNSKLFILTFLLILISSCGGTGGKTTKRTGSAEVGTNIGSAPFSIIQSYEEILTLPYSETFTADSCEISSPSGINVTTPCSCSSGTCTVGVTASSTGSAGFNYTITDGTETESGQSNLTVSAVVPFTSTWVVGNGSYGDGDNTVTLPLRSGFNYNFTVDWGDLSSSEVTSFDDPDINHTYSSAGTYTITITGLVEAWYFNNSGDKNKITTVTELGTVGWKSFRAAFRNCDNLTTVAGGDTSSVTDMGSMFEDAANADPDTSGWDTSKVTKMDYMFGYTDLADPDTSSWDTSKVTDMFGMFDWAISATPNTTTWNTSSVTDMSYMFRQATNANPDVSGWDTSSVTTMYFMFSNADSAIPDTSSWDTASVTNMAYMFERADLANPVTTNWDTSNVTDMSAMFWSAPSANPDVSGWDTSKVSSMQNMFLSASAANPNMSSWDFTSVANMTDFASFSGLSTTNYDDLLVQLDTTAVNTITLDVGSTNYTSAGAGGTARGNLVGKGWTINDGGGI